MRRPIPRQRLQSANDSRDRAFQDRTSHTSGRAFEGSWFPSGLLLRQSMCWNDRISLKSSDPFSWSSPILKTLLGKARPYDSKLATYGNVVRSPRLKKLVDIDVLPEQQIMG